MCRFAETIITMRKKVLEKLLAMPNREMLAVLRTVGITKRKAFAFLKGEQTPKGKQHSINTETWNALQVALGLKNQII